MKSEIKETFKSIKKYLKELFSMAFKTMSKLDLTVFIFSMLAILVCIINVFLGEPEYIFTCIFAISFILSYLEATVWRNIALRIDAENKVFKKKNKNLKIAVKGLKDDLYKKTEYKKPIRKTIIKEKK